MAISVRKPRAIVFDILGTASKSGFLERILFPFLKINLDAFINSHWNKRDFMKLYSKIVEQSIEFNKQEANSPIVLPHDNEQGKPSLLNFINFVTENGINSPAVTQLRFKVWFEGYQQSKLRTPIYSDVPARMRQWYAENIKFYVFSNTWINAQKALLRNTNHGDLTNLISGHYDNEFGALTEPESWRRLCAEIGEQPSQVLFLTKSPIEGRAAADAGIAVVLVLTHRHNVKAVSHEDRQRFPYVRTLNDLNWVEEASSAEPSGSPPAGVAQMPTAVTQMSVQPEVSMQQPRSLSGGSQAPPSATGTRAPSTSGVSRHSVTGGGGPGSVSMGQSTSQAPASSRASSHSSHK